MKIFNQKSIVAVCAAFCVLSLAGPIVAFAAGPAPVNLLSAGNFAILSNTGITDTGSHLSAITGNIGSSPITAAAMNDVFCSEITGTIYGVDAAYTGSGVTTCFAGDPGVPAVTPPDANKTLVDNAAGDMLTAYNDAAGRTLPTATELGSGNIGGMTLAPGLYKWSTDVSIPTNVTLSGGANDVWIFQIAGNLNVASAGTLAGGTHVVLAGGALASNVFWQVGGTTGATLGTYSTFNGSILSAKQVIIQTGAVLNGRALAQTQVTLDANTVSAAAPSTVATLNVITLVVNANGGTAVPSSFSINVKNAGVDVAGSPASGASVPGTTYTLSPGAYAVSEPSNTLYTQSFTGACDSNGNVTLSAGDDDTCTIVNTDIPAPVAPSVGSGGGGAIVPLIGILDVPTPLALATGPGPVTYNYTVWNVGGAAPLTGVTVTDDKCSPVKYLSGDTNGNGQLELNESWKYSCTTTIPNTTMDTAVATGHTGNQTAVATAIATVVVGKTSTTVPGLPNAGIAPAPLIDIVKIPSRLTPFPFGGGAVTYSYIVTNPGAVSMSNINVLDDTCGPVSGPSTGDINNNNLLDPGESWLYSCEANISVSTRNIATVTGHANGFTALGYAFATVLVSDPGLPNTGLPTAAPVKALVKNLSQGSSGSDVTTLQQFLISQNVGSAAQALTQVGATGYFGALTKAALAEFQSNAGIVPALGNFGPITRAYLGAH